MEGLDFALVEAVLVAVEVDTKKRIAGITLVVLWLPEDGPQGEDEPFQFVLRPVGRVVGSLRHGAWNDSGAKVEALQVEDLPRVFERIGNLPIYGYRFFDVPDKEGRLRLKKSWFLREAGRFSFDWRSGEDGLSHTLDLFQEGWEDGEHRHLDLRIWFDDLQVFRADHSEVSVEELIAGAKRWWEAWNEDDPRTGDKGIIRLSP
jgi:hypothetical protein